MIEKKTSLLDTREGLGLTRHLYFYIYQAKISNLTAKLYWKANKLEFIATIVYKNKTALTSNDDDEISLFIIFLIARLSRHYLSVKFTIFSFFFDSLWLNVLLLLFQTLQINKSRVHSYYPKQERKIVENLALL